MSEYFIPLFVNSSNFACECGKINKIKLNEDEK